MPVFLVDLSVIVGALGTLVAAFLGAWAAFALEDRERQRVELKRRRSAANRALFTLSNMWNVLDQYRKEVIEPYRDRSDAWLNMAYHLPLVRGMTTFKADDLAFLLDSEKPNLFAELLIEECRFASVIQLIEHRLGY